MLLTQEVGEDAGGRFYFGGAGAGLVVFGGARGGDVTALGLLVALQSEDLGTDEAAVLLARLLQQFLYNFVAGGFPFAIAALRLSAMQAYQHDDA